MKAFLFDQGSFVLETLDEMLAATSRKKRPETKKRRERGANKNHGIVGDESDVSVAPIASIPVKIKNGILHPTEMLDGAFSFEETCVSMCGRCRTIFLNFVAPIHTHEFHLHVGKNDVDDAFAKRMKEEPMMTA